MIQFWVVILVTNQHQLMVIIHQYVHVIVPVLRQANTKGNLFEISCCRYPHILPHSLKKNNNEITFLLSLSFFFFLLSSKYKVRRSPSRIRHLLPSSVLPLSEFHNYNEQCSKSQQLDQYRTSSTIDDSHSLLNHHSHHDLIDGCKIMDVNTDYMYDIDFDSVIQSRTETTLLQHNIEPSDLPPLYQPMHRSSI